MENIHIYLTKPYAYWHFTESTFVCFHYLTTDMEFGWESWSFTLCPISHCQDRQARIFICQSLLLNYHTRAQKICDECTRKCCPVKQICSSNISLAHIKQLWPHSNCQPLLLSSFATLGDGVLIVQRQLSPWAQPRFLSPTLVYCNKRLHFLFRGMGSAHEGAPQYEQR